MKNNEKWKFTEPDPHEDSPETKERKGMIFLLAAGLIFFAAGLYASWKIGALEPEKFLGKRHTAYEYSHYKRQGRSTENFIILTFNSPWLLGIVMISASLKYFYKNRK